MRNIRGSIGVVLGARFDQSPQSASKKAKTRRMVTLRRYNAMYVNPAARDRHECRATGVTARQQRIAKRKLRGLARPDMVDRIVARRLRGSDNREVTSKWRGWQDSAVSPYRRSAL